jgi:hypothetical protein
MRVRHRRNICNGTGSSWMIQDMFARICMHLHADAYIHTSEHVRHKCRKAFPWRVMSSSS